MFKRFETLLRPTDVVPNTPPPTVDNAWALIRFYGHFLRQVRGIIALLFCAGFIDRKSVV